MRIAEDQGLTTDHALLALAYDVQCIVERVIDVDWNRFSRANLALQLEPMQVDLARILSTRRAGRSIGFVELGCGKWNPFGLGFAMLLAGFDRAYCVDTDPPSNPERAAKVLADAAAMALVDPESIFGASAPTNEQVFTRIRGFDLARLRRGDAGGIDASRLVAVQRIAEDTGIEAGAIALSHSSSFLEHVTDLDAVLAELARIMASGAAGVHIIDAVDHRIYDGPEHGALVRLPRVRRMGDYDMNRLRPHELIPRFERHGFTVVGFEPIRRVEVTEKLRASFDPPYRAMSLDELAVVGAIMRVRKR